MVGFLFVSNVERVPSITHIYIYIFICIFIHTILIFVDMSSQVGLPVHLCMRTGFFQAERKRQAPMIPGLEQAAGASRNFFGRADFSAHQGHGGR